MSFKNSEIKIVIDTREQAPLDFQFLGFQCEQGALPFGDYSIAYPDLVRYFVIERKSLQDLVACCGQERIRFQKELLALRGYRWKYVLCEFCLDDIAKQKYRGVMHPNAIMASITSWQMLGVPFIFAGNRNNAAKFAAGTIRTVVKRIFEFSEIALNI